MALPVAIQSVVFYYLACTPCMSARGRHRAKKKFDKERKERQALEEDEPPLYRHPSPFNVNPYWQEEIMMGPSLPSKKSRAAKQNSSQRKLTSSGKDSSIATRSSLAISNHGSAPPNSSGGGILQGANGGLDPLPAGAATNGANATVSGAQVDGSADNNSTPSSNNASGANVAGNNSNANTNANGSRTSGGQPPSSPTLIPDDARSMSMLEATATAATVGTTDAEDADWNTKRYQRPDEELWGSDHSRTHKFIDRIAKAGSSAGRLLEGKLGSKERGGSSTGAYYNGGNNTVTDQDRANFYSPTIIHPPINDYHPPVVGSKPAHKDALRWMLQPPPPAKVMEGKVPVSRSTSVTSSMNGGSMRRSTATTAGAGSEVSLTRRMALEARLRRGDSTNSGATVTGRPHASSSTSVEDEADFALAQAAATANLSRSVSRKSGEIRPKSQQRLGSRGASAAAAARSRSGSLASSVEDPNWSSDEDGMLRTKWRFPGSAPPPIPAMPALPATAVLSGSNGNIGSNGNSQNPSRAKLETILSSDASGKIDMSRNSSNSRKENKRPDALVALKSATTSTSTVVGAATVGNGDATKAPHDRSAGSSLDSGLALSS
ncbi:hypothetical protein Sste5346_007961 [Sporothrix stenoceras]|uniref:Signal peptide-containing protein n=1 Tax=Sporothrix stenoceras TaxID=5173 RepID=A0ABR3YRH4_9PEZI